MPRILVPSALLFLLSIAAAHSAPVGSAKEGCTNCKDAPATATTFVQEFDKMQQETAAEILRVAGSVPEQKYSWKSSKSAPSVLELLKKIAEHNHRVARLLRQAGGSATATRKKEAMEQVQSSFQAISRGVAAFPPGTDPGKIQVDMTDVRSSMREYMMRHLAWSAQALGELKVWAQLAAEAG